MNRVRLLFVDDDRDVLEGLQNLLRKDRDRWDMRFAAGADKVLEALEREPFEIVISDMRMPGMDGAELFARIKDQYPSTARIILSGHAERDAVLRALPVAHQYLSKPCDAVTLRTAIEHTCQLMTLLNDERLRAVVGKLVSLPSVAASYAEISRVADDPAAQSDALAELVERDPAMAVKVLQLANFAYFGAPHGISSIREAIGYLGVELLTGLALTSTVFSMAEVRGKSNFSVDGLQEESILAAKLAKKLAPDPKLAEAAFTAALVKDIGHVVLSLGMPEEHQRLLALTAADTRPSVEVEREQLGFTHAEVGAYLLGMWGVPFPIVETVAHHHEPSRARETALPLLAIVHAADALVCETAAVPCIANHRVELDLAFLERSGLASELPRWRAIAAEELGALPCAA